MISPLFFDYIRIMKNILNERVFASFAIGICVILSAYVFMKGYADRNGQDNVIHVTGMGSRNFDSDLIVWRGSFSKTSIDLAAASAALESDRNTIKNYLDEKLKVTPEVQNSNTYFGKDMKSWVWRTENLDYHLNVQGANHKKGEKNVQLSVIID
jgi:hypothetical protein